MQSIENTVRDFHRDNKTPSQRQGIFTYKYYLSIPIYVRVMKRPSIRDSVLLFMF